MACLLRSPCAVQEPIQCIPVFSISVNSIFFPKALFCGWYCTLKTSKNVVRSNPWGPSQKNPKLAKGKAFYGAWYQICLKKKIQQNQHTQQQPSQTTPAASWRQFQRFPMPAIKPAGRMQLCKSPAPTHVWWSTFVTLLTLQPRISKWFVLAQVFWHCRKQPLPQCCLTISLY